MKELKTNDTWYGMTYKEDVEAVRERKENRFLRPFGRDLTVCIRYVIQGCTKQSIMSGTDVKQQRPIWKTAAAASPIMPVRMRSGHLQSAAKTGCSASQ